VRVRTHDPKYFRLGTQLASQVVRPFAKGIENVVSGLKERVFYINSSGEKRPPCERKASEVRALIGRVVDYVGLCSRATGSEFIATRTGYKRTAYEKARANLSLQPRSLRELAKLSFFTKTESTVHSKEQVPRIISPRSFEFNYLLGKYIRPVENVIFDGLGSLFYGKCVAKGCTMQEKGTMIYDKMAGGRLAVGLDASRFDQTISRELLDMEHSIYRGLYPGDRLLDQLLREQLVNSGRAICKDGSASAVIGDMRCSGDQNTSLGNCIISCLLARLYFDEHGISGDVINDGDDLVMFVKPEDLHHLDDLTAWYLKWGLRMKVEKPVSIVEEVEFCQAHPVCVNGVYTLVRNPEKCLNTDYAGDAKVAIWAQYLVHLRSVGLCGLAMAAGVPVLQEYYSWGVRHGTTGKLNDSKFGGSFYQARLQRQAGYLSRAVEVTPCTRHSFWLAFGVEPSVQIAIEQLIRESVLSRHDDESTKYYSPIIRLHQ